MAFLKNYELVKYYNTRNRPMSVTWDITNRCNMNCLHCFNSSGDGIHYNGFNDELSKDEMLNVAAQIIELRPDQCCICGGETLLSPYWFDVIKILTDGGIITNIVTNGFLISKEVATKLKESGVNNVQISIDGIGSVHDSFRNTPGAFEHAVSAVSFLQHEGINPLISFCPNRRNYKQFDEYVEYINQLECVEIRMMPLLPLGRGNKNYKELMLDSDETFEFVQLLSRLRDKYPHIKFEWGDPLEHLALVINTRRKYPLVMGILSNGDINITPYIPFVVGNVKNKSLREYWELGYCKIWSNQKVLSIINQVRCIYDLQLFNENPLNISIGEG